MDEQPIQLFKETRVPLPMESGQPEKYDHEYERNGTANHFLFTEPLGGWRRVSVRERKTKKDWAQEIKELLDQDYPAAKRVILICDNLSTHGLGSLYETFSPEKARRLAQRLEIHHTPKHGSGLSNLFLLIGVLQIYMSMPNLLTEVLIFQRMLPTRNKDLRPFAKLQLVIVRSLLLALFATKCE
jgi:hypothetical protein